MAVTITATTVDSAGTPKGTPSLVDATTGLVTVANCVFKANGDIVVSVLAEEEADINVKYADGSTVTTTVVGGEIIIPNSGIGSGDINITNSDGGLLYTVTVPEGGTVAQPISNSTAVVRRSDTTTIVSEAILAEGSENIDIADSSVNIKRSDTTTIVTKAVMADSTTDETIGDSQVDLKKSDGTTALRSVTVMADSSVNETIGKATVDVYNEDGSVQIGTKDVEAEETDTLNLTNNVLTVNTLPFLTINPTAPQDIELLDISDDSPITPTIVGNQLKVSTGGASYPIAYHKTQPTSTVKYTDFDEGDLFLNGVLNGSVEGIAPIMVDTDRYNLDASTPNKHGNLKILTGKTGGYKDEIDGLFYDKDGIATTEALAFPDNVIQNHYYGKEILNSYLSIGSSTFTRNTVNALGYTAGGYTNLAVYDYNNWYVPSISNLLAIQNIEGSTLFTYNYFAFPNANFGSCSPRRGYETTHMLYVASTGLTSSLTYTTSYNFIIMRNF